MSEGWKNFNLRVISLLVVMMSITIGDGFAQTQSGTCGANLTWSFNEATETLTISGSGDMENYNSYPSYPPWYFQHSIKTVVIENGVTSIGNYAFGGCYLTSITIPESVKSIGNEAFWSCSLTSITIPKHVTSIEDRTFGNCSSLVSITIPDGVKSIGNEVFIDCIKLTSITIPQGVTSIGDGAFINSGLISIIIPDNVTSIGDKTFYTCHNLSSITIGNGVTSIGDEAFAFCISLTSLTISENVTSIGNSAFYYCSSLTSLTIPSNVKSIGNSAFLGCSNLQTVNYNATNCATMENSSNSVFLGCNSLITLNIGNMVATIPNNIFFGSSGFKEINVEENNTKYTSDGGILFDKAKTTLFQYPAKITGTSYTIPNSVKTIADYAFNGCTNLSLVTIPSSVTNIGEHAFSRCIGFTSITIPASVTSIGNYTFYGCVNLETITLPLNILKNYNYFGELFHHQERTYIADTAKINPQTGYKQVAYSSTRCYSCYDGGTYNGYRYTFIYVPTTLKTINITDNAEIKDNFFQNTNLETISMPLVTKIGNSAFNGCSNLTFIKIPENMTSIGSDAFFNCPLKSVVTPVWGSNWFPSSLENLTITSACSSIPANTLSKCSNLKDLTLPFIGTSPTNPTSLATLFGGSVPTTLQKLTIVRSSVNIKIADNALSGLSNLTELTLPSNIQGVGEKALYDCSGLKHIYSHWAYPPTAYNNSTFQGVNKFNCTLHVPIGSKQYYSVADGWKEFYSPIDKIEEEAAVTLTVRSIPLYGGVVDGRKQYNYDETATLTARGNMGYTFQGWMEDDQIVNTAAEYAFTVVGPRMLFAIFTPRENGDENVQIVTSSTSASVTWTAVTDAASYSLIIYSDESRTQEIARFRLDENGNLLRAGQTLSCSVPDLNQNTQYYYTLTSYARDEYPLTISNGNFRTQATTEIETPISAPAIRIYPNPVTESFYIGGMSENMVVTVSDICGKTVLQSSVASGEIVSVAHLSKGVYIVRVAGETVKVVKR